MIAICNKEKIRFLLLIVCASATQSGYDYTLWFAAKTLRYSLFFPSCCKKYPSLTDIFLHISSTFYQLYHYIDNGIWRHCEFSLHGNNRKQGHNLYAGREKYIIHSGRKDEKNTFSGSIMLYSTWELQLRGWVKNGDWVRWKCEVMIQWGRISGKELVSVHISSVTVNDRVTLKLSERDWVWITGKRSQIVVRGKGMGIKEMNSDRETRGR